MPISNLCDCINHKQCTYSNNDIIDIMEDSTVFYTQNYWGNFTFLFSCNFDCDCSEYMVDNTYESAHYGEMVQLRANINGIITSPDSGVTTMEKVHIIAMLKFTILNTAANILSCTYLSEKSSVVRNIVLELGNIGRVISNISKPTFTRREIQFKQAAYSLALIRMSRIPLSLRLNTRASAPPDSAGL